MNAQCEHRIVRATVIEGHKPRSGRPLLNITLRAVNKGKIYPYNSVKRGWSAWAVP